MPTRSRRSHGRGGGVRDAGGRGLRVAGRVHLQEVLLLLALQGLESASSQGVRSLRSLATQYETATGDDVARLRAVCEAALVHEVRHDGLVEGPRRPGLGQPHGTARTSRSRSDVCGSASMRS